MVIEKVVLRVLGSSFALKIDSSTNPVYESRLYSFPRGEDPKIEFSKDPDFNPLVGVVTRKLLPSLASLWVVGVPTYVVV